MLILIHLWIQIKWTKRIFLSNYSLNCQLPSKVKSIQPFPTDNNTCYRISRHNWFSFTLSALWRLLTHMVHLRHWKLLSSSSSTSSPWWWSCCPPGWCSGCTICSALLSLTSTTASLSPSGGRHHRHGHYCGGHYHCQGHHHCHGKFHGHGHHNHHHHYHHQDDYALERVRHGWS